MAKITKCYNCGCIVNNDNFGAGLQKMWLKFFVRTVYLCQDCWLKFFVRTVYLCQDCYSNPQNFGVIVRRFYNAGLKL